LTSAILASGIIAIRLFTMPVISMTRWLVTTR